MRGRKTMIVVAWVVGVLAAIVFVGWLGLQVQPAPFPAYAQATPSRVATEPLPAGLPAPVERFYRTVYGGSVPIYTSAVLTGRCTVRPAGPVTFPGRYRFTHVAGQGYRHYIEACWFGIPVMKVNERYLDGRSQLELSLLGKDSGPKVEYSANLGMWAESWSFPALFVTDARVKWEPLDDETALLVVPYGAEAQRFVVRFDPKTGLPVWTETMRYHNSKSPEKTLWLTRMVAWEKVGGVLTDTVGSATWMDDGKPWATFSLEHASFNVDVANYVRGRGL